MFGTWLGVILLFGFFALVVWVVMSLMPRGNDYEQKRATARFEKLKTVREEANGALNGYAWIDKTKGSVRVPIARAMELSVPELARKKPAPANPIGDSASHPGPQAAATVTAAPAPSAAISPAPNSTPAATEVEGVNSENRGQKVGENNPPNAPAGTQPGANATPVATPPAGANQPHPGPGQPTATPMQVPPGTPIPVPGKKP